MVGKKTIALAAVLLVALIIISSFIYLNFQKPNAGQMESINVAYSPFESLTLFWVAQDQGFYSQNNLNVTSHKYDSGSLALGGVLNGEDNIVVGTTEFPLTINALNGAQIRTFSTIAKSEFIYLVARADRGINTASDLKGKTIGTTFGTIAHFYLGRFLELNGINIQDVNLVDLKTPAEWVNAVVNGSVDAVATAQPYAEAAKAGLADNAVFWSIQSSQPLYAQAIATNEWIINHPELVNRFLRALMQAEDFVINHPDQSKAILKNHMNFSDVDSERAWGESQFSLSLDQSLLLAMRDEAQWLISNHLTNSTTAPNFINYVYQDGLKSVNPSAINIIG